VDKAEKLLQKGKTADALAEYRKLWKPPRRTKMCAKWRRTVSLAESGGKSGPALIGELFERQSGLARRDLA